MTDNESDCSNMEGLRGRCSWTQRGVLGAVCALVIGVYAYTAHSGFVTSTGLNAADNYYNLLVQGFRAGQLNLKAEVPPGLAELTNPYDPSAHSAFPVSDMTYYNGKLYLYFGVTPALLLFWPFVGLTGHYLLQKDAALIFCSVGFLASVSLLWTLRQRYFGEVSVWVVAAGALALGLATFVPSLLARCDVWEVPISCGYALTMLALLAIWKALHQPERRGRWLATASLLYGLVVGARPSLLFGAIILLVPVAQARREQCKVSTPLLAAIGPMIVVGLGLMLYNWLRFDNPFEFGFHYQLAGDQHLTRQSFNLSYLWFNLRVYFLELAHWSGRFPFVHDIVVPPLPRGYWGAEHVFGVLTNVPLVWLALTVPMTLRSSSAESRSKLCAFLAAVTLLFVFGVLTLGLYYCASDRFEVEFLPELVLLAVIGILGLERAFACRAPQRRAMRWGWSLLLIFSVAFNLLASLERCAEAHNNLAVALAKAGQTPAAISHWERALRLKPDYAKVDYNWGVALAKAGQMLEAISHWEQALRIKPDYAEAHFNLGIALARAGQMQEAISHWEEALRIKPDYAEAHYNLGLALEQSGDTLGAIAHYEQALRIKPDLTEARSSLARLQAIVK